MNLLRNNTFPWFNLEKEQNKSNENKNIHCWISFKFRLLSVNNSKNTIKKIKKTIFPFNENSFQPTQDYLHMYAKCTLQPNEVGPLSRSPPAGRLKKKKTTTLQACCDAWEWTDPELMVASLRRADKIMQHLIEEFWVQSSVNTAPALSCEDADRGSPTPSRSLRRRRNSVGWLEGSLRCFQKREAFFKKAELVILRLKVHSLCWWMLTIYSNS